MEFNPFTAEKKAKNNENYNKYQEEEEYPSPTFDSSNKKYTRFRNNNKNEVNNK